LYDTAGNVWEWVEDCDHGNYKGAPIDGSAWREKSSDHCDQRVFRGGAYGSLPENVRSSKRNSENADYSYRNHGFRLARDMD